MRRSLALSTTCALQFNCSTVAAHDSTISHARVSRCGTRRHRCRPHAPSAWCSPEVRAPGWRARPGQRLLDATASLWHANIGHGRARLARAAYEQMRKLETYHTFGRFANEPALRLADRLVEIGPIPGAKVMLTSGGSDSVDLACKLARRHWQLEGRPAKKIILSRIGAYHGLHAYGTSVAGLAVQPGRLRHAVAGPGDRAHLHQRHRRGPAVGGRPRAGERGGDHRRARHRHRRRRSVPPRATCRGSRISAGATTSSSSPTR